MLKIKNLIETKTNRNFGLIMSICFFVVGALIPFFKHKPNHISLLILASLFLFIAFIAPNLLTKPRHYWLILGEKLGIINTKILFTLIYLSVFSLVHLVFIMTRRDRLMRAWKKYPSTYQIKTKISSFADPF